ncbi:hypothetical protein JW979_03705 [bacterium]|nr:hypothetical protein [candidate division CSSED10-310 bacterium]
MRKLFLKTLIVTSYLGMSVFFYSCTASLKCVSEMPCENKLSTEVISFFDCNNRLSQNDQIFNSQKSTSIIAGTHSDLYVPKNGIIVSRKYGWRLDIKYNPFLKYEAEQYVLISTGSQIDRLRFAKPAYWYIVIRKRDGKIVDCIETHTGLVKMAVFDDVFYFRIGYDDPRIHCMNIGE